MGVAKISVSIEEDALAAARQAAEALGVSLSAWLSQAARYAAGIQSGLRAVAEHEAEHGPIPQEALRKADRVLDEFGIGR